MQWQEYFDDAQAMVETIQKRLTLEGELIRYVNLRYRLYDDRETKWLYDVKLELHDTLLIITTGDDQRMELALADLEYIKLRPFYYAACVGFKEFTFYGYPDPADNHQE